ncbi:hypothetical protein RFI_27135 [Reticulomyxa filosa]|uniref:Uncharacterized protein n=1 Tax=Reticulomyxa filosa TaxID=46433 RepID=X6M9T3_RETFI|nr:hypothetical protein RFI_27135 [Reticulomyxa filosa]|eukprot:ETO10242.1 hypothetical protein RFI_27135 [Reticulomyxa filosa]
MHILNKVKNKKSQKKDVANSSLFARPKLNINICFDALCKKKNLSKSSTDHHTTTNTSLKKKKKKKKNKIDKKENIP